MTDEHNYSLAHLVDHLSEVVAKQERKIEALEAENERLRESTAHRDHDPEELLITEDQLSERSGVATRTLQDWRFTGERGPKYVKLGGAVRYRLSDVYDRTLTGWESGEHPLGWKNRKKFRELATELEQNSSN